MNKENCELKLVDEIILYYDARSKKHHSNLKIFPLFGYRLNDKVSPWSLPPCAANVVFGTTTALAAFWVVQAHTNGSI